MTVQELINELNTIQDKSMEVRCEASGAKVVGVVVDEEEFSDPVKFVCWVETQLLEAF